MFDFALKMLDFADALRLLLGLGADPLLKCPGFDGDEREPQDLLEWLGEVRTRVSNP